MKLPLYAEASVPEVWLADVNKKRMLRFAQPIGGVYTSREEFTRTDKIAPAAFPDAKLDLA